MCASYNSDRPNRTMLLSSLSLVLCLGLGLVYCLDSKEADKDPQLSGLIFTENLLFERKTRCEIDCARVCSKTDRCVTLTFTRVKSGDGVCRGHSSRMNSSTAHELSAGTDLYDFLQDTPAKGAKPTSCVDSRSSSPVSGVVTIYPDNVTPVEVYCDQDTDGGGWAVFQRRQDGSVDFYRNWADYQNQFGNLNGEFWIGLDALHTLTSSQTQELRVDLTKWDLTRVSASYSGFTISDGDDNYRLNIASFLGGSARDSLITNRGMQFSTNDADHDTSINKNCAKDRHGAWWYKTCTYSNLNGQYKPNSSAPNEDGLIWYTAGGQYYSMKATELKLRPR